MKENEKWSQSDWGANEPIEMTESRIGTTSTAMTILLGGVILGFISAFWYMAGD